MTKKSPARLARDGHVAPAKQKRNFTPQEVLELQEMHRAVASRFWEAAQLKGNTALVPRGQEVLAELEALARLGENAKNQWVANKLQDCGYEPGTKCSINLTTGEIVEEHDTPKPASN
jgi:hypothetical protein